MAKSFELLFLLCILSIAFSWSELSTQKGLHVVEQWAELEFVFPSEAAKQAAIEKEYYIPGNSVAIDVDVHYRQGAERSRMFITTPRFGKGRPITLGTVDDQSRIHPYPDYSWHDNQGYNCAGLTSVWRVAIDQCNRLWVMDAGKISEEQVCPPQVLAFDLSNDKLIYRHVVEKSSYIPSSLYVTPVVDVRCKGDDCSDTFVYVADVDGYGILVLDVANDRSWRVSHRLVYPYPSWGNFTIDGVRFDVMDGIFGMALSPLHRGQDRILYFHALASVSENIIYTSVLRNSSVSSPSAPLDAVTVFSGERSSQSAAEAMDRNGILYFGQMNPPSVWCWNTKTEFSESNIHSIAVNEKTLQFASGVKVVNNLNDEQELWVMTNRYQRVATGTLNSNEINFRVNTGKIPILPHGSSCYNPPSECS